MASVRNAEVGFRAIGFCFCREAVARKRTADEMPYRTVSATLSRVCVFVGARTREGCAGQIVVKTLDRSDDWITKSDSLLSLRKRQDQRQKECGENAADQHKSDSPDSCQARRAARRH
jgi:hypothetical protein